MFLQLWHVGRVSLPIFIEGNEPVSASKVPLEGRVPRTDDLQYGPVRALENKEVYEVIEAYVQGARNAIKAGFDGVEIHGANGYLIDQFLHQETNKRDDEFGGSMENRARFCLEIVTKTIEAIGKDRVGIRLSPGAYMKQTHTKGDEDTYIHVLKILSSQNIAYIHTGIFDDSMSFDYLGGNTTSFLRAHYRGTLIACGSYTPETAAKLVESGQADMVAIGRPLIANPDYIEKITEGSELTEYNADTMLGSLD